jgi:hypothetical protein
VPIYWRNPKGLEIFAIDGTPSSGGRHGTGL